MNGFSASEEFVNFLTSQRHLSKQTVRCYELDLEQFISFLRSEHNNGDTDEQLLAAVNARVIKAYMAFLKSKKYSRSSTARKLASLRTFYKFFNRQDGVKSNPAKAVHIPKAERHQPRLLKDLEVRKLLQTSLFTPNWLGARNKALLQTLYSTGIRVGELVALDIDDIDLDRGLLYVRTKGKKEREISLERSAVRALADYVRQREKAAEYSNGLRALFLNRFGRRLSQRDVRRKMDKYLKEAGLDRSFSPRSLRHSFAARKLHTGYDLCKVKELLGHQAISSTLVYVRAS